ncbi:MAG: cupin domain-containing protein [Deltaproteobacteria bacterium]|jgi:transcriptional regulator with XRE-family HTH domain|nr:cupin domain-containing protein [Deltaproteobacteria bacterium]
MEEKNSKLFRDIDFFEDLTGDIPAEPQRGVEDVGQRIRKIREEKGLALDELSRLTGFEVQFLSSIEKNEAQPQLGTVIKLSKALDSAFGRLVSGVGDKLYSITRKNERRTVSRSTSRTGKKQVYTYKSLAPEVKGRHMEALIVQLEVDPDREISVHEGEEFIFVLNGIVVLEIGDDKFELEPGDSVYYLSTTPHHIAAKNDKATILAVLYEG